MLGNTEALQAFMTLLQLSDHRLMVMRLGLLDAHSLLSTVLVPLFEQC